MMTFLNGAYVATITMHGREDILPATAHARVAVDADTISGLTVNVSAAANGKALVYDDGAIVFASVGGGGGDGGDVTATSLTVTDGASEGVITFDGDDDTFVFDKGLYTGNNGIFCGAIQSCGGDAGGSFINDMTGIAMRSDHDINSNGGNLTNVDEIQGVVSGESYAAIGVRGDLEMNSHSIAHLGVIKNNLSVSGLADDTDARVTLARARLAKASWVEYTTTGSLTSWLFGQGGSDTGFSITWWDGGSDHAFVSIDTSGRVSLTGQLTLPGYMVEFLPSGSAGSLVYVTNGRKSGEGSEAGTGIPAWHDGANWRNFYNNSIILL